MKTTERLQIRPGAANLEKFSATLQELASHDRQVVVVCSDSRGSGKLIPFGKQFPEQLVEVGIAEQNLVGIAAGLASCGKNVFAVSPACFLTARSFEQIKNDVAYSDNPVNLIGISAGVSYGALGSTHHSLHDFAALRAVNNLTIVAPADNYETEMAIRQAADLASPVYLRFGKKAMPFLSDTPDFQLGKGRTIRAGTDAVILATGETVYPSLLAAIRLEQQYQWQVGVISMHTIKPLDEDLLEEVGKRYPAVLTVEEHSIYGGLGEACAAFFMQRGHRPRFKIMGIPDEYTVTGSQKEIFEHYGISESGIAKALVHLLH
ncbi:transketolase [Cyclobacterium xiamenense]|uniref:Transketolase n=1 Tax=Cyclobacterium xiamenense TaxID=1297121 RepID=A0A1H7C4Z5_9BACT|nr:transketolase C-terminal domain-containing protein [Cyclobacterium xiamenense]SEJ82132.1 transketolase [Cyclobacterium xiamenense]